MTSRSLISLAVASVFFCSAAVASGLPVLKYDGQKDILESEAIPSFSSIKSNASSVTFKEVVGTPGSVFDVENGTVMAENASQLIFEKGLHTESSGSEKNGLKVTEGSSVTILGESSFQTSGYKGPAIYVGGNSTLRFENAEKIKLMAAGAETSAIVAESSTVELINSTVDSFMSNSLVGIDLTESALKLDQSTVATSDRRIDIDNSSIALTQSELNTYKLQGSGSLEATDNSKITLAKTFDIDGKISLADSQLTATDGTLSNGSLQLSGASEYSSESLQINNGELHLSGEVGQSFAIDTLTGENLEYYLEDTKAEIAIGNSNVTDLTLHASGTVNDTTSGDAQEALGHFGFSDSNPDGVVLEMDEGMYQGSSVVVFDENNKVVSQTTQTNTLMQSTLELAAAAPLALNRILTNDVHKRMGDIRSMKKTSGAWVRYDGGKLSAESGLDNDFHTIQVGVDTVPAADAPRFGLAFSYTKSDADYSRGEADMDAYSLAAYGLWMGDAGQFVDVVARLGTAKTDMTVDGNKKGSMDNVVTALSGEFGWRFDFAKNFYVEPQVELAYTHVDADSLSLSDGSTYRFDDADSLMGRAGFALGLQCPENGNTAYLRVSAVHEFLGDAAVTGGNGTVYEIDGKDT